MKSHVAPESTSASTLVERWRPLRRHAMWKCDLVSLVSDIITELSAASEFITCCTATWRAWISELQMFISQADVDGEGGRHTVSTLLLSNLQAGTVFTIGTGQSETEKQDQSVSTKGGDLVAASPSPLSKKTILEPRAGCSALLLAP